MIYVKYSPRRYYRTSNDQWRHVCYIEYPLGVIGEDVYHLWGGKDYVRDINVDAKGATPYIKKRSQILPLQYLCFPNYSSKLFFYRPSLSTQISASSPFYNSMPTSRRVISCAKIRPRIVIPPISIPRRGTRLLIARARATSASLRSGN